MYTLLLVGCILAVVLCPLFLDAILTWKETHPKSASLGASHRGGQLFPAANRLH